MTTLSSSGYQIISQYICICISVYDCICIRLYFYFAVFVLDCICILLSPEWLPYRPADINVISVMLLPSPQCTPQSALYHTLQEYITIHDYNTLQGKQYITITYHSTIHSWKTQCCSPHPTTLTALCHTLHSYIKYILTHYNNTLPYITIKHYTRNVIVIQM